MWGPDPASIHRKSLISSQGPLWGRKRELCWLLHYSSISFLPFLKNVHLHIHKVRGVVNKIKSAAAWWQVHWTKTRERQRRPAYFVLYAALRKQSRGQETPLTCECSDLRWQQWQGPFWEAVWVCSLPTSPQSSHPHKKELLQLLTLPFMFSLNTLTTDWLSLKSTCPFWEDRTWVMDTLWSWTYSVTLQIWLSKYVLHTALHASNWRSLWGAGRAGCLLLGLWVDSLLGNATSNRKPHSYEITRWGFQNGVPASAEERSSDLMGWGQSCCRW